MPMKKLFTPATLLFILFTIFFLPKPINAQGCIEDNTIGCSYRNDIHKPLIRCCNSTAVCTGGRDLGFTTEGGKCSVPLPTTQGNGGGFGSGPTGVPPPAINDFLNSATPNSIPSGDILNKVIGVAVTLLFIISIFLCLAYIIWGGFFWITSEGDKQRVQQARQRIGFAIVGLIVVFLAYFIINLIYHFFFGATIYTNGRVPFPLP